MDFKQKNSTKMWRTEKFWIWSVSTYQIYWIQKTLFTVSNRSVYWYKELNHESYKEYIYYNKCKTDNLYFINKNEHSKLMHQIFLKMNVVIGLQEKWS